MEQPIQRLIAFFWILLTPAFAWATHQVGGQIEMQALGTSPGAYRITVTNYLEAGQRADQQTGGVLGIFRQRDNLRMTAFSVRETGQRKSVVYANETCANQRNLRFIVATFAADVQLDPATYNDPGGYYISYQTRNRNASITNIVDAIQTGYTFYLEFPALLQNGRLFTNSSPRFPIINGEYVCVNQPFTFAFGGTDPDGDELRYTMIAPLNHSGGNGQGAGNVVSPAPYPDVIWAQSFGTGNAIPGSPALTVNEQTGKLAVTANRLGLFVFAVQVSEYRNGVKIGEVRRDFQLLVVDCPPAVTPNPVAEIVNRPNMQNLTICPTDSALLRATFSPDWNYQWRRDGVNLTGATSQSLTVRTTGEYTVIASTRNICSQVGNSETLTVKVLGSDAKLGSDGHLCATSGVVSMSVQTTETNVTYQWYRNGIPLSIQTGVSTSVAQGGNYWAVLLHRTLGCISRTDTARITRSAAVSAVVRSNSGFNRLCPDESLSLLGSGGVEYAWQRDGQLISGATSAQYSASATGAYTITATDLFGCTGVSARLGLVPVPPVRVTLDSLPPVCGANAPVYTLQGSPAGGEYAGPGLQGSEFSPLRAGVGNFVLTYTVKPAPECVGTVASRTAVVSVIPTINMTDTLTTYRGNTFLLTPVMTGNPNQFLWSSAQYLDNDRIARPMVQNIQADVVYTLYAVNASGCEARDTVRVTVFNSVGVPDAFSPNSDGMNDRWVLSGIRAFPNAIVTVFSRWGDVIYRSRPGYPEPFDGTQNGTPLPAGLYAYTVYTVPEKPVLRGSLMLVK